MINNFEACLAFTLAPQDEGGWSDDPRDSGGATNHGITFNTLCTWRAAHGEGVPPLSDLETIKPAEVSAIYGAMFWNVINGDKLPLGVDLMVFDFAVMAGPGRGAKILQVDIGLLGDDVDGFVGPETIARTCTQDPTALISMLYGSQSDYYHKLSAFQTFGNGWMGRLLRRKNAALAMIPPFSERPTS